MSLYNLLHGVNPLAGLLLAALGTEPGAIPRFRDCFVQDGKIVIHTRTGGGNREEYEAENEDLHDLPGFISDTDDDFDCTYANFRYEPPAELAELIAVLDNAEPPPAEKWLKLFDELQSGEQTPAVKHALEVGKPILDAINKMLGDKA